MGCMARQTVTFRADPSVKKLIEETAKRAGMTVSGFLEMVVLDKLGGSQLDQIADSIEDTRGEIEGLRRDLGTAVEALLVAGGESVEPEDAAAWVREKLGRRSR